MTFSSGTKLSHYEILEPIGAGGMGEVYTPDVLFRVNIFASRSPWDVLENDEGFLVIARSDEPSDFTIVWNWAAELDARAR